MNKFILAAIVYVILFHFALFGGPAVLFFAGLMAYCAYELGKKEK